MTFTVDKSNWTPVTLGEVVKNVNVSIKNPAEAGIDRTISLEHLDPGEYRVSRWGTLEDNTSFTRRVRPRQTLFGKRRAYLRKVAFADFEAVCTGDILVFEPKDENVLLPEFLPFLVSSDDFFDAALRTSAGSMSPRTSWKALSAYEFLLPPIDEQQRIANLLWDLERHKQSLMLQTEEISNISDSYFETLIRNHRMVELGDEILVVRGGSPRPINSFLTDDQDGINWIKIGDVEVGGKYIDSTAQRIRKDGIKKSRLIKPGDLLLSNSMSFGRPYLSRIEGCIHDGWLALTFDENRWHSEFLYYLLRSSVVQRQFKEKAAGSTVKNLNIDLVKSVAIPIVDLKSQKQALSEMEQFSSFSDVINTETIETSYLKKRLSRLFFGDTDVH